jgi:hypothetical protein
MPDFHATASASGNRDARLDSLLDWGMLSANAASPTYSVRGPSRTALRACGRSCVGRSFSAARTAISPHFDRFDAALWHRRHGSR